MIRAKAPPDERPTYIPVVIGSCGDTGTIDLAPFEHVVVNCATGKVGAPVRSTIGRPEKLSSFPGPMLVLVLQAFHG